MFQSPTGRSFVTSIAIFISMWLSHGAVLAQSIPVAENRTPNSYIGIGGAIGTAGNTTALGTGGVAILSKVRFTDNLSLHDATILFGNGNATSMIIVTADFPIRDERDRVIVSPFIGGGAMLQYVEGLIISPAISGGIDVPIAQNLTGTIRLNAGFPNNRPADIGILIGGGYSFGN
jgi:hypothetical protein